MRDVACWRGEYRSRPFSALRPVCPQAALGCPRQMRSPSARRAASGRYAWRDERAETAPALSAVRRDKRRESQPIHGWTYSARAGSFRARKTICCWKGLAGTCGRLRRLMRKAGPRSCLGPGFPAPRPRLRKPTPKNQTQQNQTSIRYHDPTSATAPIFNEASWRPRMAAP